MADKKNDIFLELVGPSGPVAGGCTDDQYSGQIEVDNFTFTVVPVPRKAVKAPEKAAPPARPSDKASMQTPKGTEAADDGQDEKKRKDDSLTVVKHVDKASPVLLQSFCKYLTPAAPGRPSPLFQKAALTFRLSRGGAPLKLLVLLLSDVAVIDYQFQPVQKGSTHPTEKVSFSYKTLEIQYRPEPNAARVSSMRSVTFEKTKRQIQ